MNSLIFYSSDNTGRKKDATGAFIPESKRLLSFLDKVFPGSSNMRIAIETKGKTAVERMSQVERTLEVEKDSGRTYSSIWFLCHGYPNGIQFGYKWRGGARRLSSALLDHNPAVEMVTFYCCSVCKNRDNFAKWIFEYVEPSATGSEFQVFGHFTAGHTTKNEKIKIYLREFLPFIWSRRPVAGYNELVSRKQYNYLNGLMKKHKSDFRFAIVFVPRVLERFGFTESLKPME